MDPILRKQMIRDEGYRDKPYKDTAIPPNWTIGIGHLLGDSPRMSNLTPAEINALYVADSAEAEALARKCVAAFPLLDGPRQRALINMAFNRGEHMTNSTTITPAIVRASESLNPDDWKAVTAAIKASPWAVIVKDRATRLAKQLETGVDQ